MDDRTLLELAAKAAGIEIGWLDNEPFAVINCHLHERWNPLTDDGDALRLAVKLGIEPGRCFQVVIDSEIGRTGVRHTDRGGKYDSVEEHGSDPYAATRRAIVRAAAALAQQE